MAATFSQFQVHGVIINFKMFEIKQSQFNTQALAALSWLGTQRNKISNTLQTITEFNMEVNRAMEI